MTITGPSFKRLKSQADQVAYLKKKLGYVTYNRPPRLWLKTGSKTLNAVIGSRMKGLPYGKIITLAGKPSSGKTLLALRLMGKAQMDGAVIGGVDYENSLDTDLALKQGLDVGDPVLDDDDNIINYDKVAIFQPEFGIFDGRAKKRKRDYDEAELTLKARMQSAEQVFELVMSWLKLQRQIDRRSKIALWVDSTTSFQPEEEITAGMADQNMRTRLSLAVFLNKLTKDLMNMGMNTNALIVLISQLRTNPTMWGVKDYVPGGNGVLYYPSSVNYMKRVRNIIVKGTNIGLEAVISNKKNKMGTGSVEGNACGVRMYYNSDDWEFFPVEEITKREDENG